MSEGWLFRLRSSLGAQHSVPAWPSSRSESTLDAMALRRPAPALDGRRLADDVLIGDTFAEVIKTDTAETIDEN